MMIDKIKTGDRVRATTHGFRFEYGDMGVVQFTGHDAIVPYAGVKFDNGYIGTVLLKVLEWVGSAAPTDEPAPDSDPLPKCDLCKGTGSLWYGYCTNCDGTGRFDISENTDQPAPATDAAGSQCALCFAPLGEAAAKGMTGKLFCSAAHASSYDASAMYGRALKAEERADSARSALENASARLGNLIYYLEYYHKCPFVPVREEIVQGVNKAKDVLASIDELIEKARASKSEGGAG